MPERISPLFFPGPAGRLEGVLHHDPDQVPARMGVVCHPHPLYGGTLHNKVVFRAAQVLVEAGLPVLRFNFRGVNHSHGRHDGGRGERDDLRAALDFMVERFGQLPIFVAGFSFGAGIALEVAPGDRGVPAVLAIAPPIQGKSYPELAACPKPKAVVQGGADTLCPPEHLDQEFPRWAEPKLRVDVPGASHFFDRQLGELRAAVRRCFDWAVELGA